MIVSVSWKNIWRNKTRSMVVILAVALGLFGTVFMIALMNGLIDQKVDASISNELSNIQIHTPGFLEDKSIQHMMDNAGLLVEKVKKTEGVKAVCRRTKSMGMVSTASSGSGVMVNGIIPQEEKMVTDIHKHTVDGSYFEQNFKVTPSIFIGKKLAEKLNAGVGSKIVMTIQSTSGDITYGLYRVVGIYKTDNAMYDEANVFVENTSLVDLIAVDPDKSSEIAILLENNDLTDKVTSNLKDSFPKLSVLSWKESDPAVFAMISLMDQFSWFMVAIIMIALVFVIVNAMLMAILERTREIGMLMAIGMNKRRVFLMIMMETIFLSITGAIAGILLTVITVALTYQQGINFAAFAEGFESIGYSALVFPTVKTTFYISIGVIVIITAAIASVWPARKALKLQPAAAVREDA
ncbi:MAG: ABC transporter permease [Bacteroidetes bacterium]|nr:ABC transporter permease [Bacteroidota bacterium]